MIGSAVQHSAPSRGQIVFARISIEDLLGVSPAPPIKANALQSRINCA